MSPHEHDVATLRAFNRAYTVQLGLLNGYLDKSPFTLSEARILYELAHRTNPTAAELCRTLHIDRAQVSRTLKRFADRNLIEVHDDPSHGRNQFLLLTEDGREAYAGLDGNTRRAIGELLEELPPFRRRCLLSAANTITRIFDESASPTVTLRGLRPGDLGMVAARQGIIYADEFGWDGDYEALVARILADYHQAFEPAKDAAWIADIDGRMAGSIFLVHTDQPDVAKLRLLYVEPDARGVGVGKKLVTACIEKAQVLGYKRLDLWTTSAQAAARSIYQRAGFTLVDEIPSRLFGHDLVGQTWSLAL